MYKVFPEVEWSDDTCMTSGDSSRSSMATMLSVERICLFILSVLSLGNCVQVVQIGTDINSLLQGTTSDSGTPTTVPWDLPDVSTPVGQLLQYRLGLQNHQGEFQIKEIGKNGLPSWLTYNRQTDQLEGVPMAEDIGQHNIAIIPQDNQAFKHFFTVIVKDDSAHPAIVEKETGLKHQCRLDDPLTMVAVVLDTEVARLDSSQKASLLSKFLQNLNLKTDGLKLLPLGNRPAYDRSALVAGPGNTRTPTYPGIILQWPIGCGTVDTDSMAMLEKLEKSAADGTMAEYLGHNIVGWHVTNNKPHIQTLKRKKRQIVATPTLDKPKPTKYQPRDNDDQYSRIVPTMASPSHGNKHHRTKTTGRHLHKTKMYRSPAPTPSMEPVRPSVYIQPSPSETIEMTQTATYPVTRPDIPVQPSITVTDSHIEPTQPLPDGHGATVTTDFPPFEDNNHPPKANEPIRRVTAYVGEILQYKIPKTVCHDKEDGDASNLHLMLNEGVLNVPRSSWLQFNSRKQMIFGLPMSKDIVRRVYSYTIVCIDSGGKIARSNFEVVVKQNKLKKRRNHEFTLVLDEVYDQFTHRIQNSIDVADKIRKLYGDSNTDNIIVTDIIPGSVKFSWTNSSTAPGRGPCPQELITSLLGYIFADNNTLNPRLVEVMKPYKIKTAFARSVGSCTKVDFTAMLKPPPTVNVVVTPKESTEEEASTSIFNDTFIVTIIVPLVVIGAMILLAALVACILYRKKRQGKLSYEDKHTFVNKGIPVIFADEMEEKPDPPTKPLIMEDEKPPLPPPEYHHHHTPPSTPRADFGDHMMDTFDDGNDRDERDTSPPYHPPPPVTSSHGKRNSKPARIQAYRHPPPYVPP